MLAANQMNEQPLENTFVPQDQDLGHWSSYLKKRLIVLVTSQKRHRVVSEIAGIFSGRAILEIIAREGHTKHVIALCFQPIKTLDLTQTCNKYIYAHINT